MRVRHRASGTFGWAIGFHAHSISDIMVCFDDGTEARDDIQDYDIYLIRLADWKHLPRAFKDRDIIPSNRGTTFGEPDFEGSRERGWIDA